MERYTPSDEEIQKVLERMESASFEDLIAIWNEIGEKWVAESLIETHARMKREKLLSKVIKSLR